MPDTYMVNKAIDDFFYEGFLLNQLGLSFNLVLQFLEIPVHKLATPQCMVI